MKAAGELWPWLGIAAPFAVIAGAEAVARGRRRPDLSLCDWVVPDPVPPAVTVRAVELLARGDPLGTEYVSAGDAPAERADPRVASGDRRGRVRAAEGLRVVLTWEDVHDELARRSPRTVLSLARGALPDPRALGARESIGLPRGQGADLRFPPDAACRGLHVQAFPDRWEAHLDQVHPECDLLGHLRRDAPTALVALVTGATLAFIAAAARYRSARPAWTR